MLEKYAIEKMVCRRRERFAERKLRRAGAKGFCAIPAPGKRSANAVVAGGGRSNELGADGAGAGRVRPREFCRGESAERKRRHGEEAPSGCKKEEKAEGDGRTTVRRE